MKLHTKLFVLLSLGLITSGCSTAGLLINAGASLYCDGTSVVGKQLVRNSLTGGTQLIYCPSAEEKEEDVQLHTPQS